MKETNPSGTPSDAMIHRADPAYRRRMLFVLAGAVVLGAIALLALHGLLGRLDSAFAENDLAARYRWLTRLFAAVCVFFAASASGFGLWMLRLADATARDRRWPPVAMRTSSDVRIRFLTSADSLVTQIRAGAVALFLLAGALLAWAVWLWLAG